eukprot:4470889-Lingulodinium_polyedra.AAC.1
MLRRRLQRMLAQWMPQRQRVPHRKPQRGWCFAEPSLTTQRERGRRGRSTGSQCESLESSAHAQRNQSGSHKGHHATGAISVQRQTRLTP